MNIHVIPCEDLIEHEASEECICFPAPRAITRPDGSMGWLYTHYALNFENSIKEPKLR